MSPYVTGRYIVGVSLLQYPTVTNRISASLKDNDISTSAKNVDVLVIGHGSKDPNAQISLNYVVDGLKEKYRYVSRCFLEIEQPDIFEGIKNCERNKPEILVIVFYLVVSLFLLVLPFLWTATSTMNYTNYLQQHKIVFNINY